MKSATCQICGAKISVENIAMGTNEASREIEDISEFDLLAHRMVTHLSGQHRKQASEQIIVGMLASKIYAMTWAESQDENFDTLRNSWRKAIFDQLQLDAPQAETMEEM